ncbi:MAG: hypothetical protein V1798_02770 [Pseudomonadota bacterium]
MRRVGSHLRSRSMKSFLSLVVIGSFLFAVSAAEARPRKLKAPAKPDKVWNMPAGTFSWSAKDKALWMQVGNDAPSVIADSLMKSPGMLPARNPKDKGVYYLDNGILHAYVTDPAVKEGDRDQIVYGKDTIMKYSTFHIGEYFGIALTTAGTVIVWNVNEKGQYDPYIRATAVKDYIFNPIFGKDPSCGLFGKGKKRYFGYWAFLWMDDGKVWGIRPDLKTFEIALEQNGENGKKFTSLDEFKRTGGLGDCTLNGDMGD